MDAFTIITGCATLLGLAIQLFDIFPKFARYRLNIVLFSSGIFIGSFLRAFDSSSIKLNFQLSGATIFTAGLCVLLVTFLFLAALSNDAHKRSEFYQVSIFGAIALGLSSLALYGNLEEPIEREKEQLSISELDTLANIALQSKEYERAIMHLHTIESRLTKANDYKRKEIIEDKIKQIEAQELK